MAENSGQKLKERYTLMIKDKKTVIIILVIIFVLGIGAAYYAVPAGDTSEVSATVSGNLGISSNATDENENAKETVSGMDMTDITVSQNDETVSENLIRREKVRGIYVTGLMAGSANMDNLIALVDETCLNTMVIDIKDDQGNITCQMDLSANDIGAGRNYVSDMEGLIKELQEHHIYTIARISCFKDPYLAGMRPELALKKKDGGFVTDTDDIFWVNPYEEEVWEYLTDIALAAADMGFDEIQFDYVRFPVGKSAAAADYGVDTGVYSKEEAIVGFLSYAADRLHEKNVAVGADVFGTVIDNKIDQEYTGQDYQLLGRTVDVLSPMIYPSHYRNGVYGLSVPDAYPYETIQCALEASAKELEPIKEEERAIVRPWLQSFTATWVPGHISYGGEEIKKQIQAVYDAGYDEWILWNAANRYPKEGVLQNI